MKFRKFQKKDITQIAKIKSTVFKKFNNKEYFEKKAINRYLSHMNFIKSEKDLLEVFKITKQTICYVAEENNKVVGYIKGKKDRIGNLFVLGRNHKSGIGKKLVYLFEKEAKTKKSSEIKIHSSIYAFPFYQKIGYKKTTGIRNFHGLKVQPMKKHLK